MSLANTINLGARNRLDLRADSIDCDGKTVTDALQVTTAPVPGFVLTSDGAGNATWQAVPNTGGVTVVAAADATIAITGTASHPLVAATGNFLAKPITTSGGETITGGLSTDTLKVTTGAVAGDILVSDASGNLTYQSLSGAGIVSSVTAGDATILIGGTASAPTVEATGNFLTKPITTSGLASLSGGEMVTGGSIIDTLTVTGSSSLDNGGIVTNGSGSMNFTNGGFLTLQSGTGLKYQTGPLIVGDALVCSNAGTGTFVPTPVVNTLSAVDASISVGGTAIARTVAATGAFGTNAISTSGPVTFTGGESVTGGLTTDILKVTTGAVNGDVLVSDASGNLTYKTLATAGAVTSVTAGDATISIGGTASAPTVAATGNFLSKPISTSGAATFTGGESVTGGLSTDTLQVTTGAVNGDVLVSDASGNLTYKSIATAGAVTSVTAADATILIGGSATAPTVAATGNFLAKPISTTGGEMITGGATIDTLTVTGSSSLDNGGILTNGAGSMNFTNGGFLTLQSGTGFRFQTAATVGYALECTSAVTGASAWAPTVNTITAADASISVGGTALAPTLTTGTLNQIATAHPGTLTVSNGGTGDSSFATTNAVIASGTSSTNPLQTISNGTSGQYLVSNGASSLPSFQTIQTFTATGSVSGTQYSTTSTTYANVDGTNLTMTITIPTGSKLLVWARAIMDTNSASGGLIGIADGGTVIAGTARSADSAGSYGGMHVNTVINGNGASHTLTLQFATHNGGSAFDLGNGAQSSTGIGGTAPSPFMFALLLPSA
jgi:fibronectin-binding autotransporter adhesin